MFRGFVLLIFAAGAGLAQTDGSAGFVNEHAIGSVRLMPRPGQPERQRLLAPNPAHPPAQPCVRVGRAELLPAPDVDPKIVVQPMPETYDRIALQSRPVCQE